MTKENIVNYLSGLDDDVIVTIWNEYQDEINGTERIYPMTDEFLDTVFSTPSDLARNLGDFSFHDDYFTLDGYGHANTFNYYDDNASPIYLRELAEFIEEDPDRLDSWQPYRDEDDEE